MSAARPDIRVYTHPDCLLHEPGPGHPESPSRLAAVLDALRESSLPLAWREAPLATRAEITRVHDQALVRRVLDTPVTGSFRIDADTVMSTRSAQAALRACGAGIAGVEDVLCGSTKLVFCAVRPPGHHATAGTAMGFCLFNSVAVAAAHALSHDGIERVAILDFDVHHGNGTQAIFESDARVLYLSSHQAPLYPGTGLESDTGVGNLANVMLPPLSGTQAFRAAWTERLLPALDTFAPQLVLVSAGFDAHRLDPLADLQLETSDYLWLGREIAAHASRHAAGRVVAMLEGGYSLTALREGCVALLQGLDG